MRKRQKNEEMKKAKEDLVHAAFTGNVTLVRKILSNPNQKADVNVTTGNIYHCLILSFPNPSK
jgi:hypothetical protein